MKPDRSLFQIPLIGFAVILLVHLLFLISALVNEPAPFSDSEDYLHASHNLYSKGTLYGADLSQPIIPEQYTRRPPLYPVLLGMVSLTRSMLPVILLQILLSMSSILLVYKMFYQKSLSASSSRLPVLMATLLLLATPSQFIYANRIMAEILFQFLLVLMAWSVHGYFKYKSSRYIWLFNLFLSLGMATKPVLFPFAILILLLSLILFIKTRKRALLLAFSLPLLWMVSYSVRNYNRTGSLQYASIQTANLVNYNLRYFLMEQQGSEAASEEVDRLYARCGLSSDYREKNRCLEKGVKEVIMKHPLKYGLFHLKGSIRYFIDPGRFDLVTFFNWESPDSGGLLKKLNQEGLKGAIQFLKQQGAGLLILLALIALVKIFKITGFILYVIRGQGQLAFRIFLTLLMVYLAIVTGPLGASRFLLPVELLLIGGAVAGWSSLKLKNFKDLRKVG